MANITRRSAIALAAGAAGSLGLAHAADRSSGPSKGAKTAGIERYEPSPSMPGIPLISNLVVHGNIAYLSGVTANPADLGDIKDQTRQVTARIDALLAKAGTSKAKLLTAQVFLTDMSLFAAHNEAWNEWVDPNNRPVRACLTSPQLWRPGMVVEIMVTAAI